MYGKIVSSKFYEALLRFDRLTEQIDSKIIL